MGYKVLTYTFSIGDTGVTQSDDGTGGAQISISASLTPPSGWSIINVAVTEPAEAGFTVGVPTSDDGVWGVSVDFDYGGSYPLAGDTPVFTVFCIAGDSPYFM